MPPKKPDPEAQKKEF